MGSFPTGADGILKSAESAKGGGKKFSPELFWRDGDERFILFLTALDEIPTVPAYNISLGTRPNGKMNMQTFIDPRPVKGKDAYNPLDDRFGLIPTNKQVAIAVELEPVFKTTTVKKGDKTVTRQVIDKFEVVYRSFTYKHGDRAGEEVTVPNVGVIINTHTLFKFLTTWEEDKGDIQETVFKVKRIGAGKDTAYNFIPFEKEGVPELGEDVLTSLNLDEVLEFYMSEDRYHDLIDPLDEAHSFGYIKRREVAGESAAAPAPARPKAKFDSEDESDEGLSPEEHYEKMQAKFG